MSDLSGEILCNRYFLCRLVGSGGMADVYESWDQKRSTRMAVKVLRRDLAHNSQFLNQFTREAELLRELSHPNIVRLYDFEKDSEDIVFIVMEWIDGGNLREALMERKKSYSLEETLQIIEPVCIALNYAHRNHVYHCDVKTPNILMPSDGRVLLTDFGVARFALDDTHGGTPYYMAPEQFNGDVVDARTDIYALGVILYELLSGGVFPFRGDAPNSKGSTSREKVAWEHINLPLPDLSYFNGSIPASVETVIQTAMNKEPDERYDNTFSLLEAFRRACRFNGDDNSRTIVFPPPHPPRENNDSRPPFISPPPPSPPPVSIPGKRSTHLIGKAGQYTGHYFTIQKSGVTMGRSSQNQIKLDDASVSRHHARIIYGRRGIYIEDEGSKLGTYVNNQPVEGTFLLKNGDIIRIGYSDIFEFKDK
jgi:eukaryotic-like serine/threonine-protein kinase